MTRGWRRVGVPKHQLGENQRASDLKELVFSPRLHLQEVPAPLLPSGAAPASSRSGEKLASASLPHGDNQQTNSPQSSGEPGASPGFVAAHSGPHMMAGTMSTQLNTIACVG